MKRQRTNHVDNNKSRNNPKESSPPISPLAPHDQGSIAIVRQLAIIMPTAEDQGIDATLTDLPALPEPVLDAAHLPPAPHAPTVAAIAARDYHRAAAAAHHVGGGEAAVAAEPAMKAVDQEAATAKPSKKHLRVKKLCLTEHEALTYANRGIYVDIETGQLRCSCNHKPCDKWDAYGYTRHFSFKCHKKYEANRLDEKEMLRLREAKRTYLRMNPRVGESSIRTKRKKTAEGEKLLSVDELRVQERHWMDMWKDAKNMLRQLRRELKEETDEEVRAELLADIAGLKRRKEDWAKMLGLDERIADIP
eukprot:CAMPEP_0183701946 /NCGR_PEP_ID=MMETSP0737-20130205/188_1 /TAXON_ID=385413 /ORGANISM="Thalassiosira miniscula, Strain CCMP1093" /LENGTH=305 /DNA_ID=CAMNT_0025928457 /DNA_START=21 /DNA_END=935 /DNA_ORIENTATION=-